MSTVMTAAVPAGMGEGMMMQVQTASRPNSLMDSAAGCHAFTVLFRDELSTSGASPKFKSKQHLLMLTVASLQSLRSVVQSNGQDQVTVMCWPTLYCNELAAGAGVMKNVSILLYNDTNDVVARSNWHSANWVVRTDLLKYQFLQRTKAIHVFYFEIDMYFLRSPARLLSLFPAVPSATTRCDTTFTYYGPGRSSAYGTLNSGLQYFRNSEAVRNLQLRFIARTKSLTANATIKGGENQLAIDQIVGPSIPFGQWRLVHDTISNTSARVCSVDFGLAALDMRGKGLIAQASSKCQKIVAEKSTIIALHFVGTHKTKMSMLKIVKCFERPRQHLQRLTRSPRKLPPLPAPS